MFREAGVEDSQWLAKVVVRSSSELGALTWGPARLCVYTYMYIITYICVCVYVCMRICICIFYEPAYLKQRQGISDPGRPLVL